MEAISSAEANRTAPRGTVITYLKQIELVDEKKTNEDYLKEMGEPCSTCTDSAVERDASGNVIGEKKPETNEEVKVNAAPDKDKSDKTNSGE